MLATSAYDHLAYCASFCAYFVQGKEFVPPTPGQAGYDIYKAANFINTPIAITGGKKEVNAAIFAETPTAQVVAFRGTLPPNIHNCISFLDWLHDLEAEPASFRGMPGEVHTGIFNAYQTLRGKLFPELTKMIQQSSSPKPLIFTGHSKGGPMATYATWDAHTHDIPAYRSTITFASPHPGNAEFANAFKAAGLHQTRYEGYLDVVPFFVPRKETAKFMVQQIKTYLHSHPHLPTLEKDALEIVEGMLGAAEIWDYQPVGTLQYITSTNQIMGNFDGLWMVRLLQIMTVLTQNPATGTGEIVAAHSIGCGGHYQKGVYPHVCS